MTSAAMRSLRQEKPFGCASRQAGGGRRRYFDAPRLLARMPKTVARRSKSPALQPAKPSPKAKRVRLPAGGKAGMKKVTFDHIVLHRHPVTTLGYFFSEMREIFVYFVNGALQDQRVTGTLGVLLAALVVCYVLAPALFVKISFVAEFVTCVSTCGLPCCLRNHVKLTQSARVRCQMVGGPRHLVLNRSGLRHALGYSVLVPAHFQSGGCQQRLSFHGV